MSNDHWGIRLVPPTPSAGPTYWIGKAGGDGPGWTISPSTEGRLEIPKHDAERICARPPMIARLKAELGWTTEVVQVRKRRKRRKERKEAPRAQERRPGRSRSCLWSQGPEKAVASRCRAGVDLLRQVEALRQEAERLVCELDVDSAEGYFVADVNSTLALLIHKAGQLLLESNVPE